MVSAFGYNDACVAATGTGTGSTSRALSIALGEPSPGLIQVAEAFVSLQSARHDAEYNHEYDIKRADALSWIATARYAVDTVRRLRKADDPSFSTLPEADGWGCADREGAVRVKF